MSTKPFNGTEKDYAISLGLAKAGRGRMSLEAKKAVQEAKKGGMVFRTKGAPTATVMVAKKPSKDTEKTVTEEVEVNQYADAFYRYDRDQMFSYTHNGKTYKINGKGACMNCGYSLVGHTCNDAVVLTYHGAQKVTPVAN
jgi:hypothetical protein